MAFTTLAPGARLAQYEIIAPLGAGGMGEVYRARDLRLEREVAIKVLPRHLAANDEMRSRFEREARAVAALSHPSILSIHEFAVAGELMFAVMELLVGQSLRQRLTAGPMAWRQASDYAAQVADGLAAAHAKGIVHRDIKPENLFVLEGSRIKILDFGLARSSIEASREAAVTVTVVTESGAVLGSMGYMSPEQLRGEAVGPATDMFALGCVLYEMVEGRRAFSGATPAETISSVLSGPMPVVTIKSGDWPQELDRIIAHCLARVPGQRFPMMRDLSTALRALLVDSSRFSGVRRGPRRRGAARAIAVLPFANAGGEDSDYLADGICESIINALSQLPRVRVVPRTTVFQYKGRDVDLETIALTLNARTIVTGRVVQRGDQLIISAELIDASSQSQLWGEQYRYPMSNLLAAQDEIAWHISEALRIRLTGAEKKKLKRRATENNEAYQEYLRGRYHWGKWNVDSFRKASEHFERALDLDPTFAAAWAGLGDVLAVMAHYGMMPVETAMPRAKTAARRALELDPELAEAHATLGIALLLYDWDFAGAETEIRRAVELNPRLSTAHVYLSLFEAASGRTEEAVEAAARAVDLEPLALLTNQTLSWAYFFANRPEATLVQAAKTLELDPSFGEAQNMLLAARELQGDLERAIETMSASGFCAMVPVLDTDKLRQAATAGGPHAYWQQRLADAKTVRASQPTLTPVTEMVPLVMLGKYDEALELIEEMIERRDPMTVFLAAEPYLYPLRGNPRFDAALKRVNPASGASTRSLEESRA